MSGQTQSTILQLSLELLGGTSQLLFGGNSSHHRGFKMEGAMRALIISVFCLFLAMYSDSLQQRLAECERQTAAAASPGKLPEVQVPLAPDLGPHQPGGWGPTTCVSPERSSCGCDALNFTRSPSAQRPQPSGITRGAF